MARRTDGEKIDELEKAVASLVSQMAAVRQEVKDIELGEILQRLATVETDVAGRS
jgi:hypothetical protein